MTKACCTIQMAVVHTFANSISRSHTAGTVSTLWNIYPGNSLVNLGKRVWCNFHQIEILKTILPVDSLSVPHPFSIWFNGLSPFSQAYVNIVDLHGQTVIFPSFLLLCSYRRHRTASHAGSMLSEEVTGRRLCNTVAGSNSQWFSLKLSPYIGNIV